MNNLIEQLKSYPQLIAAKKKECFDLAREKTKAETAINSTKANIDLVVSNDPGLRNETMRKARKIELLEASEPYQRLLSQLDDLSLALNNAEIELSRLKSDFAVLKLEVELAIAQTKEAA